MNEPMSIQYRGYELVCGLPPLLLPAGLSPPESRFVCGWLLAMIWSKGKMGHPVSGVPRG